MKLTYVITFIILYLEIILKTIVLKKIELTDIWYTTFFSIQAIIIINLLCHIFKEKISKGIYIASIALLTIYYGFQTVFYNLFGIPFSFSTLGLAKGALSFKSMAFDAIIDNIGTIIILFIPYILSLFFIKKIKAEKYHKKGIIISILLTVILIVTTPAIMLLDKNDSYSAYKLYYEIDAQEINIEKFGLLKATLIDIKRTVFGFDEKIVVEVNNNHVENTNS